MLVAVAFTLALGLAEERPKTVVLDLAGEDADVIMRRALSGKIAARLSADPRIEVLSGDDVRGMATLDAERQAAGCDDSCLSELAGALDARFVVSGSVGRLGAVYIVNLSIFDAREARSIARRTWEAARLEEIVARVDGEVDRMLVELPLAPRKTEGNGTAIALVIGGGLAVALGAGAAGWGALLGAEQERTRGELDDAARTFRLRDTEELADKNDTYAAAREAWATYGIPLLAAGAIGATVGAAAITGGILWPSAEVTE